MMTQTMIAMMPNRPELEGLLLVLLFLAALVACRLCYRVGRLRGARMVMECVDDSMREVRQDSDMALGKAIESNAKRAGRGDCEWYAKQSVEVSEHYKAALVGLIECKPEESVKALESAIAATKGLTRG